MMNKAIKYRLNPTNKQIEMFSKTFGCCRKYWNLSLNDRQNAYKEDKSFINPTPAMYKEDYPYLKEVDSLALANVQMNQNKAYRDFFNNKKNFRLPKFKAKHNKKQSYTTNNVNNSIRFDEDYSKLKIPKVGFVKIKTHKLPKDDWKLKSITISKVADKYYVSILFEFEENIKPIDKSSISDDKVLGLDYSSSSLYKDSNNTWCDMPHYYRENQSSLAKAQRKLSRKIGSKKGEAKSHNYIKQEAKVNKIHNHIANQRLDYLHKKSRELANKYDVIVVEDINMKNISRSLRLGKATMDNGFGLFRNLLDYKLKEKGGYLIKVNKWYPSTKTCSSCGSVVKSIPLGERTYVCDKCGLVLDRDYNAAINIKKEGLKFLHDCA